MALLGLQLLKTFLLYLWYTLQAFLSLLLLPSLSSHTGSTSSTVWPYSVTDDCFLTLVLTLFFNCEDLRLAHTDLHALLGTGSVQYIQHVLQLSLGFCNQGKVICMQQIFTCRWRLWSCFGTRGVYMSKPGGLFNVCTTFKHIYRFLQNPVHDAVEQQWK